MTLRADARAWAWSGLAALLALGSVLAWWLPAATLDWQPALAAREPWRAFSAAFVHWSLQHLAVNLAGVAVLGLLGRWGGMGLRATLAWALAWPCAHWGLLWQPALAHYGGMSGVVHAGVAVAGWWLVLTARGRPRGVGAALLIGLVLKVVSEDPFGAPLVPRASLDIAVAPLAHATGALAGSLAALALRALGGQSRT